MPSASLDADTLQATVRSLGGPAEIYDTDEAGELRPLAVNGAAARLAPLGAEQASVLGAAVRRCLLEGAPHEVKVARVGSGTARPQRHSLLPLVDGAGEPAAVLCVIVSGSPVRTVRGERLRVLLEMASDDIWECNAELRLTRIHGKGGAQRPRLAGFLGCTAAEVLDPTAPPEDFARLQEAMLAHEPFHNFVIPVCASDGQRQWLRFSGFPLFADDGTFTGYLGTSTRITEERQRLAAERRRQLLESLGQLAGGVAHEFNNLLVPITMLSKMALGRIGDDDTLKLFLTTIHENGWKAAQIVRSVLTYARQMTPSAGPLACGEVVDERIQLLRQALPPSVIIETEIADSTSRVLGSAGELSQIVVNLFNNANDAVAESGTIRCAVTRVTLSPQERNRTGLTTDEAMRITVADTGHGIDPDIRERIFEPFFTTKPVGQGTGLGLSVVDGIVKDWGGHIEVDSAPGQGTTFTILLPVLAEEGA